MSIHYRIAEQWNQYSYPALECDEFSLPFYVNYHSKIEGYYNQLPLKAKKILDGCTFYLCSGDSMKAVVEQDGVMGLCRPNDKGVWYNIEKFTENHHGFNETRFKSLFFHEIGHYLVHHFTQKEKEYYTKRYGITPTTPGEPEADGFAAYMTGVAPYHNQEFWSWWVLNNEHDGS